jgi:SynChlorMet cassette radical SAM/SPASM protein ScmF
LDPVLYSRILDQAAAMGVRSVKFTGGEPLIHPNIREILQEAGARGLAVFIETNGVCCSPDMGRLIAGLPEVGVSVSLDGVCPETHDEIRGVSGAFSAAVAGIRNLVAQGVRPQIIMSVFRRNADEIEHLPAFAHDLGAASVKLNIVQPSARAERLYETGNALSTGESADLGRRLYRDIIPHSRIPVMYSIPPAFRPLGRIFRPGAQLCDSCAILNIIGVLPDGSYALCGIGSRIPELVFGAATRDRLEDVWRTNPILNELREGLPHRLTGACADCVMKSSCLGNCIALNYYRSRSLWAPFWFCEEMRRGGGFPEARSITALRRTKCSIA